MSFLSPLVALALVGLPVLLSGQTMPASDFPLAIVDTRAVGANLENGLIVDAAVGASGRVCQIDFSNQAIACFAPDGTHLWTVGRKGDGPGEFHAAYRAAVGPGDTVFVIDIGANRLNVFAPDGRFVTRSVLPIHFRQVDNLVVAPAGVVVLSGVAPTAGLAADSAIHVFRRGDSLTYVQSFGPLPEAKNKELLQFWGAGAISLTPTGLLVYGRRYPYEVYVYTLDGQLRQRLAGPVPLRLGPDDALHISKTASSMHVERDTSKNIVMPLKPLALTDRLFLTGRRDAHGSVWWDLLSGDAKHATTSHQFPNMEGMAGIIGVDPARHIIWTVRSSGDNPALYRLQYQIRQPQ